MNIDKYDISMSMTNGNSFKGPVIILLILINFTYYNMIYFYLFRIAL